MKEELELILFVACPSMEDFPFRKYRIVACPVHSDSDVLFSGTLTSNIEYASVNCFKIEIKKNGQQK